MKPVFTVSLPCHAKINLTLAIGAKRPDGFHELETVMAKLALHDELTLEVTTLNESTLHPVFALHCEHPALQALPVADNLITKAFYAYWQALRKEPTTYQYKVTLQKHLPLQAGLGGGSSNAAAMLLLLNQFQQAQGKATLSPHALSQVAATLGSDVPFFTQAAPVAYCQGRGEQVTPWPNLTLPSSEQLVVVLVQPLQCPIATAWAYQQVAAHRLSLPAQSSSSLPLLLPRLEANTPLTLEALERGCFNHFEPVLFPVVPALQATHKTLHQLGAFKTLLCGSGSTVAGFFTPQTLPQTNNLTNNMNSLFPWKDYWSVSTAF